MFGFVIWCCLTCLVDKLELCVGRLLHRSCQAPACLSLSVCRLAAIQFVWRASKFAGLAWFPFNRLPLMEVPPEKNNI